MHVTPVEHASVLGIKKNKQFFDLKIRAGQNNFTKCVKSIILCTGTKPKKLELKQEEKFAKKNIHYFAFPLGSKYAGKNVIVVGSRNSGSTAALYLAKHGAKVTIIEIKDRVQAKNKHTKHFQKLYIEVLTSARIIKLNGLNKLEEIVIQQDKKKIKKKLDGLFVYIGINPNTFLADSLGVKKNQDGFIQVNAKQETNIPGVYAAGDVCGNLKHIVAASGQGATAAYCANNFLLKRGV